MGLYSKKIRKTFKQSKTASFGLVLIGLALVVSVLGAVIRPDTTKNANKQNITIAKLKPFTTVEFLELPGNKEEKAWYEKLFFGGDEDFSTYLAIDSVFIQNGELWIIPFNRIAATAVKRELTADEKTAILSYLGKTDAQFVLEDLTTIQAKLISNQRFLLGTDTFGRDLLSRIMAGTAVSLSVGIIAVLISLIIGIVAGGVAGYFRGWLDSAIMWVVNVVWSVPTLLMVIAITIALGKGFVQVFIAVGLTMWVEIARVVRGQFFEIREKDFVTAARLMGFSTPRIIFKHMLPNVVGPLVVISAGNFSTAILLEAGLSFLGIGAQVPMPSWGGIIKAHFNYIITDYAYLAIIPGVCLMLLTLAFMLVGNTLRDAFDMKRN